VVNTSDDSLSTIYIKGDLNFPRPVAMENSSKLYLVGLGVLDTLGEPDAQEFSAGGIPLLSAVLLLCCSAVCCLPSAVCCLLTPLPLLLPMADPDRNGGTFSVLSLQNSYRCYLCSCLRSFSFMQTHNKDTHIHTRTQSVRPSSPWRCWWLSPCWLRTEHEHPESIKGVLDSNVACLPSRAINHILRTSIMANLFDSGIQSCDYARLELSLRALRQFSVADYCII
jgi:hypothetical protein